MLHLVVPAGIGAEALRDLDKVPWGRLSHAYGHGAIERSGVNPFTGERTVCRTTGVDEGLRHLVSADPDDWDDGLDLLYSRIFHQGSVFESTTRAVPFLLAFAADATAPNRTDMLVALLSILAEGVGARQPEAAAIVEAFRAARRFLPLIASAGPEAIAAAVHLIERAVDKPALFGPDPYPQSYPEFVEAIEAVERSR